MGGYPNRHDFDILKPSENSVDSYTIRKSNAMIEHKLYNDAFERIQF